MSLARTHRRMWTSSFEIGVQYRPPAFGRRSILNHNFSDFRWYSPIRPRQTRGIAAIGITLTQRVFWPQIYFSPLVSWIGGQEGWAKFFKEFNFLGFSRCFSAKIEQSSKTSKIELNNDILGWFFEVSSILAEKQRLKPRKLNSLKNFAALDTLLDPQLARIVK